MNFLGLAASGKRNILQGNEYDYLFPMPDMNDEIVVRDGNVKNTVRVMADVVHKYLDDTRRLVPVLQEGTLKKTCEKIWDFIYNHIQYRLDTKGTEQLRRPARSWLDRKEGVDCDCYSIFASSVLTNLGIPHHFKVTRYEGDWQHVYVIVPDKNNGYYTIDCVVEKFDYEKPYTDKFLYSMSTLSGIPIAVLSGFDESYGSELYGILSGSHFDFLDGMNGADGPSKEQELKAIYDHLVSTRDYIQKNPGSVMFVGGPKAHLQMLNYAIASWNTPDRDKALETLTQEEERWNAHSGLSGEQDEQEVGSLGAPKKGVKKFWSKVKETVKKVDEGAKKVGKTIVRYNPVSIAVRNGFLLAMKINLFGMAEKLFPAYLLESEAKSKGISIEKWNASKRALARVEKMFSTILQGKKENLKKAITTGKGAKQQKGFKGLGELGEPATIAAVAASAIPLAEAAKAINEEGLGDEDTQNASGGKENFLKRIGDWFKRVFKGKGSDAKNIQTASSSSGEDSGSEDSGGDGDDKESAWSKIKNFVTENPGKTAVGVLAAGSLIALAASANKNKTEEKKSVALGRVAGRKVRRKGKSNLPASPGRLSASKKKKIQLIKLG